MLQTILWLLGMYFAVIGLIRTVAMLVELLWPPTPPRGCRLFLQVEEDADYTESGLMRCHRRAALYRAAAPGGGGAGDLPAVLPGLAAGYFGFAPRAGKYYNKTGTHGRKGR